MCARVHDIRNSGAFSSLMRKIKESYPGNSTNVTRTHAQPWHGPTNVGVGPLVTSQLCVTKTIRPGHLDFTASLCHTQYLTFNTPAHTYAQRTRQNTTAGQLGYQDQDNKSNQVFLREVTENRFWWRSLTEKQKCAFRWNISSQKQYYTVL